MAFTLCVETLWTYISARAETRAFSERWYLSKSSVKKQLYDRRNLSEAHKDLSARVSRWQGTYPRLCDWVEENIIETLTFYRLPLRQRKHLKSTNMLEKMNEEIKRRTRVVCIFPNAERCLGLIRALAVETHEGWLEEHRYLNMQLLAEHKREQPRQPEEAA